MSSESIKYWYVYLLKCKDESTYTGCTSNLKERMKSELILLPHFLKNQY